MDEFSQHILAWQPFYTTVAGACATLSGLLFVSLSLNISVLKLAKNDFLMRKARAAFISFLYVLLFSLMFLIPGQTPTGLGTPLLIMGGFGIYNMISIMNRARRDAGWRPAAAEFWLSLLAYLGLIAVSVAILNHNTDSLHWLVALMCILLISASKNAWDLLVEVQSN